MKKMTKLLTLLLALMLALPCAVAEEAALPAYEPIKDWLINNQPAPAPYAPNPDCYLPNNTGYEDPSISVHIETTYWTQDVEQVDGPAKNITRVLAARVKISDPSQLRTALAANFPSKQVARVDKMAQRNNAVLAINGDYFNNHSSGVTYRNGRQLRFNPNNLRHLLIIDTKGDFYYLEPTSRKAFENFEAQGLTALHTFWFGPNLVMPDGSPRTYFTNNENNAPYGKAQRMVIGQVGPLEYLILCSEGPESTDYTGQGFTLPQMAKLCVAYGLDNGYNLDGGSSASLIINGEKINSPTTYKYREVGDCIYFATLVPNE